MNIFKRWALKLKQSQHYQCANCRHINLNGEGKSYRFVNLVTEEFHMCDNCDDEMRRCTKKDFEIVD